MTKKDMYEEGKLTKKMRENPWIISTFVLGVLCLVFLIGEFIPEEIIDESATRKINKSICLQIRVVPSWVNEMGQVQEGLINFNNETPLVVINELIKSKIYFVYSSGCGACKRQIESFEDSWDKYVDSGLTINCG